MRPPKLGRGAAVCLVLVSAGCAATPTTTSHTGASSASTIVATSITTTTTAPPATTAPPPTTEAPTTTSPTLASGIQVGPGPQTTYTVQPQAAPGSCHYAYSGPYPLPDPRCTPGAINPHVTQANISSTICSAGYAESIRPPESVTEPEKIASAAAYDYAGSLATAEYDHLIPLELGGDPNDPANLWVEPNDNPAATTTTNTKDSLEDRLHSIVCSDQMPLAAARQAIAADWAASYGQLG